MLIRQWKVTGVPGSVYMAMLIADTKKRADLAAADYETSRDALRRKPLAGTARAPLRFLPAPAPGLPTLGEAREVGARDTPFRKST